MDMLSLSMDGDAGSQVCLIGACVARWEQFRAMEVKILGLKYEGLKISFPAVRSGCVACNMEGACRV